jgi:hypothetical protein
MIIVPIVDYDKKIGSVSARESLDLNGKASMSWVAVLKELPFGSSKISQDLCDT